MKTPIVLCALTLIGCIGITTLLYAAGSTILEGDVLKIEGEVYTLHDRTGHDVRVHVDTTTQLEGGAFKVGDKVEAYVTETGHARSIIRLISAGKKAMPGSRIVEGDVLKMEGEFYTLHDRTGHDVRVHVDTTTQLESGAIKVGDKVEAYVTEKGHARSIHRITHLQPSS